MFINLRHIQCNKTSSVFGVGNRLVITYAHLSKVDYGVVSIQKDVNTTSAEKYGGIHLPPTCELFFYGLCQHVNMQDNYVNMQDKNKMQLIYVNMQDIMSTCTIILLATY